MTRHLRKAARSGRMGLAVILCAVLGPVLQAEPAPAPAAAAPAIPPLLPVEDFARAPQYINMQLSPDGTCIGYQRLEDGGSGFGFLTLADMKTAGLIFERKGDAPFNAVYGFQWLGSKRVLAETALGWALVDRDARTMKYVTGYGRYMEESKSPSGISAATIFTPDGIVGDDRQDVTSLHVLHRPDFSNPEYRPDLYQLDVNSGIFKLLEKNPGDLASWVADWDGNVRFGLIDDGVHTDLVYREKAAGPWNPPVDFGRAGARCRIAGLEADNRTLYVFKPSPEGRLALYSLDLPTRRFSEPLFQHKKYDVTGAIFSPKHRRLLGVRYDTEMPRQYWFEPEFRKLQESIDAASPGLVNEIVSMDRELKRILVFSRSARDPGRYILFDLGTGHAQPIAKVRPWLRPEDMAEMFPVKTTARDGLEVNGYLTLPAGRERKGLPLVTLVHGGPFGVRDVWGFDPLVQFLANRGYAVLQVNYRGSGGYGTAFYDKGRREVGGAIQDDIVDLTQWAVRQGVADPHRLAIMGGSYGGYSTLFALAQTPDLFRCGIACMAVSDWGSLLKYTDDEHQYANDALRYWAVMLGDTADAQGRKKLAAVSPVNMAAQIKAPVLLVHGREDSNVPIDQTHKMVAALKKAGHPPETLYFELLGHSWPSDKKGVEFLRRVESFLAANLEHILFR